MTIKFFDRVKESYLTQILSKWCNQITDQIKWDELLTVTYFLDFSITPILSPVITIPRAKKCADGKRIYDKEYYCPFCLKTCLKLWRHYLKFHSDEDAVKKIIAEKGNRERRKRELERLRNLGSFYHNMKVRVNCRTL